MMRCAVFALFAALLPVVFAAARPALADGAATESVELELREGWNTVSLPVTPADKRLSAIFQDVLADIVLVKDDAGNTYIPEFDIDTIGEWDPLKAYMVNARSPVALSVTGVRLAPQDAGIPLKAGWNLIPYLLDEEKTVEEALASIIDLVVLLKDQDGNIFSPAFEIDNIKVFRPGRGYQINVSEEAVLTYPGYVSVPGNPGNRRFEVNTISDAIALTGMVPGDRVTVLGYHEPGDGGGGEFIVDDGADEIDGGTAFSFLEHEVEHTRGPHLNVFNDNGGTSLHPDVVYGSLRFHLNDTEYYSDTELHGHRLNNGTAGPTHPLVLYREGRIQDYRGMLRNNVDGTHANITYRTNPTPIRLKRIVEEGHLNIDWFGAPTADPDNPVDARDIIAHVINLASMRGIPEVLIPRQYYYYGPIEIKDGLTLRGLGKDVSALRVIPEIVLEWKKRGYDRNNNRHRLHGHWTVIMPHSDALWVSVRDLEIDGNWENNRDAFDNPDDYVGGWGDIIHLLQNTPFWNGIAASVHGGRTVPLDQQVILENLHAHGFGGNVLLSSGRGRWEGKNLRLGNSIRNHVMYGTQGYFENITIYGFAWGTFLDLFSNTEIRGLYFRDGADNPNANYTGFINFRGGSNLTIDGFDLDFTGCERTMFAFSGIGDGVDVRNGRIKSSKNRHIRLFVENGNGFQRGLYKDYLFENIEIEVVGNSGAYILGASNTTGINTPATTNLSLTEPNLFRNITVVREGEPEAASGIPSFWIRAWWRNAEGWDKRQVVNIEDVEDLQGTSWILKTDVHEKAAGLDLHIRRSRFRNTEATTPIVNSSNNANLSGISGDINKLRVFWKDVEFNLSNGAWMSSRIFGAVSRFHNCRTLDGRTSEDQGQFQFTSANGQTIVEIPTNLFWHSSAHDVSGPQVGTVESVRSGGVTFLRVHFTSPLNGGQEISLDWNAAVRPFDL